jgi:hypothetical protein
VSEFRNIFSVQWAVVFIFGEIRTFKPRLKFLDPLAEAAVIQTHWKERLNYHNNIQVFNCIFIFYSFSRSQRLLLLSFNQIQNFHRAKQSLVTCRTEFDTQNSKKMENYNHAERKKSFNE